ncbi:MAG: hypothetical protein RIR00_2075 [Pseudomonadota bacterium]
MHSKPGSLLDCAPLCLPALRPDSVTASSSLAPDSLAFSLRQAAGILAAVFSGRSLAEGLLQAVPALARPAVQDMVYASLRAYGYGDALLAPLLAKPPQPEIRALLLLAVQRLEQRPEAAHTVVDQAVTAAAGLAGGRFKALVNGVLRNFLRQREALLAGLAGNPVAEHRHPEWWLNRLRYAYPEAWQQIIAAGNQPPPMALRVNRRRARRDDCLTELQAADIACSPWGDDGLLLAKPLGVEWIPGFAAGRLSVQDPGAQRAAALLDPAPGSRVLDACAAPGGKTAHLLERAELDLLALDLEPARCRRISANLERLGLSATVQAADAGQPASWWDGRQFDAILADVPCSASGVVRRHPDSKWLRREADVQRFARTQARLLAALWPLLRPGGKLLYATCSVFREENGRQIASFLDRHPEAEKQAEEQLLPCAEHDGFYYALLRKSPD